jgi:hypothetical protein
VQQLVLEYYFVLRWVLRRKPGLRRCLSRCRYCGIFFLSHPRNAGRADLRCPFGCAAAHRRECGIERSTAYYRTESGKMKKRRHNSKRRRGRRSRPKPGPPRERVPSGSDEGRLETKPGAETEAGEGEAAAGEAFDAGMVDHIRVMTSLIEEREVSREEVLEMLDRVVRQHSIDGPRRLEDVLRFLRENPP